MVSSLKEFGETASKLAKNPLGIIALFQVLIYGIAGYVTARLDTNSNLLPILVWFLVVFPVLVLGTFTLLVVFHHQKLYAPSDYSNEENFMKALEAGLNKSERFRDLESLTERIKKEINEQPLYRYTKLNNVGKLLILITKREAILNLEEFAKERKLNFAELEAQAQVLANDYRWITLDGKTAQITEVGKKDMETFVDFVYARWGSP